MRMILILSFAWFPVKVKIKTLEWVVCTVQSSWEDLFLLVHNSKINNHLMKKKEVAHSKAIKNYWIECCFRLWSSLAHGSLKELLLRVQ